MMGAFQLLHNIEKVLFDLSGHTFFMKNLLIHNVRLDFKQKCISEKVEL